MAAPNEKEIVLITGANTGLGFEVARKLLRFGRFHVLIGARTPSKGEAAVKDLHDQGLIDCEPITVDITSTSSLTSAAETISQKFGHLDILHCNAGIAPEAQSPAGGSTPISELIKLACDTNVAGSAQTVETFIPLLQKAENPRIIFMSTGLGSLTRQATYNNKNWPAYAASKAAMNMMMLWFFHQYPEMKINASAPGFRVCFFIHLSLVLYLVGHDTTDADECVTRLLH